MSKKKTIAVAIVLALLLLIGGLLAYFTDTEKAENKFTLGNVDIQLTEPNWDTTDDNDNNVPDAAEGMLPGTTVDKDPTVTNLSTTTPAYVFVKVQVPAKALDNEVFTYTVNSGWTEITSLKTFSSTDKKVTHVYAYGTASAMTSLDAADHTAALFDEVTMPSTKKASDIEGLDSAQSILVDAYGIQTQNLGTTDPAAIYALASAPQS